MTIAVAGSTGGIGSAVVAAARRRGCTVVEVNRGEYAERRLFSDGAGPFDAVVFAIGTCPVAPLLKTDDQMFAETIRVNCTMFLRLVREVVESRLYAPGAKFVAVSSVSAVEGWAGGAAYCASKGALSAMCRALSCELAPRGISVAALEPRYVATKMFERGAMRMGVPISQAMSPESFAEQVLDAAGVRGEDKEEE